MYSSELEGLDSDTAYKMHYQRVTRMAQSSAMYWPRLFPSDGFADS